MWTGYSSNPGAPFERVLDKELGHPLARLKIPANGTLTLRYKVSDR